MVATPDTQAVHSGRSQPQFQPPAAAGSIETVVSVPTAVASWDEETLLDTVRETLMLAKSLLKKLLDGGTSHCFKQLNYLATPGRKA